MAGAGDSEPIRQPLLQRGRDCAGATDIGVVRRRNEDAYWIAGDGSALVVADGLGGLPAGDVASALAVTAVAEFLDPGSTPKMPDARPSEHALAGEPVPASRRSCGRPRGPTSEHALAGEPVPALAARACEAAARAQQVVIEASQRSPACRGMATTLVVALIDERKAVVVQIGDSRAALWRGKRCVRTTIDQNGAGDLVRAGVLTAEQARVHPSRNMVREVIGLPGGYQHECHSWDLEAGDVLLLVTDGVSEAVPEHEIAGILASSVDAASAAASLVAAAAAGGGRDNATAIVRYVT